MKLLSTAMEDAPNLMKRIIESQCYLVLIQTTIARPINQLIFMKNFTLSHELHFIQERDFFKIPILSILNQKSKKIMLFNQVIFKGTS
jgi:hypothetical protein